MDEARADLERAVALAPGYPEALSLLSILSHGPFQDAYRPFPAQGLRSKGAHTRAGVTAHHHSPLEALQPLPTMQEGMVSVVEGEATAAAPAPARVMQRPPTQSTAIPLPAQLPLLPAPADEPGSQEAALPPALDKEASHLERVARAMEQMDARYKKAKRPVP